jgi:hypothetical protein
MRRLRSAAPLLATPWLVAFGALLWVSDATAYCREVSVGAPANYDPTTLGCFGVAPDGGVVTVRTADDGGLLTGPDGRFVTTTDPDAGVTLFPLFWRNECVSYSFQSAGTKYIAAFDTARIATQAFAAWSHAACPGGPPDIVADPYPPVECDTVPSQAHNNAIIFRDNDWPYDDGQNAIGYTTLTVSTKTGEIYGADIEINSFKFTIVADLPASASDSGADGTVLDLGSILTHEAGHFFGLAHTADANAVMYAHYSPGTTALTPDDVAGICSIYGSDGTRHTGEGLVAAVKCEPAPPLGFLTTCGSIDSGILGVSELGVEGGKPNQDGGDATTHCPPGCAMGRAPGAGSAGIVACGLFALSALARRARRASWRARTASIPFLALAVLAVSSTRVPDAAASVSATVLFEQLVQESSAVAVVVPTERRVVWEGDRIVTYTHARIDRLVAGQLARDVWVRTLGGSVGDIAQIVEGQAVFPLGRPSLVFLRVHLDLTTRQATDSFVVAERGQGQFPVETSTGKGPRLTLGADLGALLSPPPDAGNGHAPSSIHDLRFARDVLKDRPLEDAAREIATAWARTHETTSH